MEIMDIDLNSVVVVGLLFGRGLLIRLGAALMRWLRKCKREPEAEGLSTSNTAVLVANAQIVLAPHGDIFIAASAHAGDIVEFRSQAESDDDVDAPTVDCGSTDNLGCS